MTPTDRQMPLPRAEAESLALAALGWIASESGRAGAFLDQAGAGADDLRVLAADPDFLGFVIDFLMADEAALLAFAEAEAIAPGRIARARAGLPGGDLPHWT